MLKAAHLVGKLNIPITGINTGRLGFLANIPKQNISDLITSIYEKKFHISPSLILLVINYYTKVKHYCSNIQKPLDNSKGFLCTHDTIRTCTLLCDTRPPHYQ